MPKVSVSPRVKRFGPPPYDLDANIRLDRIVTFNDAYILHDSGRRRLYVIDEAYFLKVYRPEIDVDALAHNMLLAQTVVPVPPIYAFGRDFNCSYILMAYVHGMELGELMESDPDRDYSKAKRQIEEMVRLLAGVNLAHNDLYPRNVIVDEELNVLSIVDWDLSSTLEESFEYERRVTMRSELQDWDSGFRRYSRAILWEGYSSYQNLPPFRATPALQVRRLY